VWKIIIGKHEMLWAFDSISNELQSLPQNAEDRTDSGNLGKSVIDFIPERDFAMN
jgi:hypothetical protein